MSKGLSSSDDGGQLEVLVLETLQVVLVPNSDSIQLLSIFFLLLSLSII